MNYTVIFCATRGKKEDTALYKSLKVFEKSKVLAGLGADSDVVWRENNTIGLSKCYNEFLYDRTVSNYYNNVVFIHDDVHLLDIDLESKLYEAHKKYDIVGLAGGTQAKIQYPALWHLMSGGFQGGNLRGFVAHNINPSQIHVTSFGPTPDRCVYVDGLFMSIYRPRARGHNWRFNENYDFHHYDLASCLDANKKKLTVGVWPILVSHNSPGLLDINDPKFTKSQAQFLSEYSKY